MAGKVEDPRVEARTQPPDDQAARGGPAHDVFVSYCTRDKPVADAIVSRLEQAGIRCWVAPRDVIPGTVWGEAIVEAIETSQLMVVVLSGEANDSPQVVREVERAVANDVVVVPFRIESIEPSRALAYYLASEHWLDAITPPLESHIAQLTDVARALVASRARRGDGKGVETLPPPPPPPPAPSPGAPRWRRYLTPLLVAGGLLIAGAIAAVALIVLPDKGTEPVAQVETTPPPPTPTPSVAPSPTVQARPARVGAPTGLRALDTTSSEVKLIWKRPRGGAKVDHFRVYRDGEPVGRRLETRSYVDDDVEPGRSYHYRVVAFGVDGSRASSKPLAVRVPSPPPPQSSSSSGSSQPPPPQAPPECDGILTASGDCIPWS